jgi:glycosyl transferase family 25
MLTQLINLAGSDARLAVATDVLDRAGIRFVRLPAFDGRALRPEELPLYDANLALRGFGRRLTGGEVGCFLSHLEAARRFLDSDADYGLVLEDDLMVAAGGAAGLERLVQTLRQGGARLPWLVANLGEPARRMFTPLADLGGHLLVRAHYFPVTTTAILWNRDGAAAFLRDASVIAMPVDHWLRRWAVGGRCGLAVNPPLFPSRQADSEIDAAAQRDALPRGLSYFIIKQTRLWRNKLRAWAAKRAFDTGQ